MKTDKWIKGLAQDYEALFEKYNIEGSVLEIGVAEGGSLEWLSQQARFTQVVGVDIVMPLALQYKLLEMEVRGYEISQTDIPNILNITTKHGGWDVVIDDGSHKAEDARQTFMALWNKTRKMYLIEDWDAAYHRLDKHGNWVMPEDGVLAADEGWVTFISELVRNKKLFGIHELQILFNEDENEFHSYIMCRRK